MHLPSHSSHFPREMKEQSLPYPPCWPRSWSRSAEGKASRPVTPLQLPNPAQRHKEVACTISSFCSILPWPPWTPCYLFGKPCQKCFTVSIIWAMLKLCCYSKPTRSENAPRRLVYTAGSGSARIRLPCRDFSFRLPPCAGYTLLGLTSLARPQPRPQSRGLSGRKTLSQPNHRTVWDRQVFPSLFQLKHWYKVWEKFPSTEKTLIFWLDSTTHYNLILNKLSQSYITSVHLVTYPFSNKKQLGLKFSCNLLQLLWQGPPQKVISRGFFLLKSHFLGEEWDVWKIATGTKPSTEVYKHSWRAFLKPCIYSNNYKNILYS